METVIRIDDSTVEVNGKKYVVEQPKFKVGDWVKTKRGSIFRVDFFTENGGLCTNDENNYHHNWQAVSVRHATPAEIEAHLIKEAKKRGYKKGMKTKRFENHPYAGEHIKGAWCYMVDTDTLYAAGYGDGGSCVYEAGQWAEIIKEPKPLPKSVEELATLIDDWYDKLGIDENQLTAYNSAIEFLKDEGYV